VHSSGWVNDWLGGLGFWLGLVYGWARWLCAKRGMMRTWRAQRAGGRRRCLFSGCNICAELPSPKRTSKSNLLALHSNSHMSFPLPYLPCQPTHCLLAYLPTSPPACLPTCPTRLAGGGWLV